ncbi:MAG: ABC transporter ATP-binding protein [Clostridia bacterium]|nr:ABC transporter ATP-binding protein [Clostridia bacterium]
MSEMILTTEGLTKKFGNKYAVDNVSINIRKGAIYGLIGMNGAGKTTIMKMITGLIKPTSGSFKYHGFGDDNKLAFSRIGALIEAPAIYPNLSAFDNLKIKCLAYGINDNQYINDKLALVGLSDVGKKKAGKFSLGMKQRLGIALALVGDPDLLLLDEPINGLDPQGIVEIREMLVKLNKDSGVTILISSHILEELSKIATEYGIINNGKIVEEITNEALMTKCRDKIQIKAQDVSQIVTILDANGFVDYSVSDANTIFVFDKVNEISKLNMEIAKAGILVDSIGVVASDLEEYFLKTTSGNK